jgi:hypothetical protein
VRSVTIARKVLHPLAKYSALQVATEAVKVSPTTSAQVNVFTGFAVKRLPFVNRGFIARKGRTNQTNTNVVRGRTDLRVLPSIVEREVPCLRPQMQDTTLSVKPGIIQMRKIESQLPTMTYILDRRK